MSVLFDTLEARFRPGTQPAIRPRPQARFEASYVNMGLREEAAETVAPSQSDAQVPTPLASPPSRKTDPSVAPVHEPEIRATAARKLLQTPRPGNRNTAQAAPRSGASAPPQAGSVGSKPPARARAEIEAPSEQRHPIEPNSSEPTRRWPSDRQESEPPVLERITETSIHTEVPQMLVSQMEAPAAEPLADARSDLSAARESPVIRIGRIEVTRPASPVTPPPKTVHASPDPPRRPAQVTHGKQPSRLTDYLGWKK